MLSSFEPLSRHQAHPHRFILDKVGRRKLFIFGSFGMGACMLISGLTLMAGGRNNSIAAVTMFYMFQVCTNSATELCHQTKTHN